MTHFSCFSKIEKQEKCYKQCIHLFHIYRENRPLHLWGGFLCFNKIRKIDENI